MPVPSIPHDAAVPRIGALARAFIVVDLAIRWSSRAQRAHQWSELDGLDPLLHYLDDGRIKAHHMRPEFQAGPPPESATGPFLVAEDIPGWEGALTMRVVKAYDSPSGRWQSPDSSRRAGDLWILMEDLPQAKLRALRRVTLEQHAARD